MSKESYAAGFGRRFKHTDGTWGKTKAGRTFARVGKTARERASGVWANHVLNQATKHEKKKKGGKR